ncbi:MAG: hypothetical protein EXS10_02595 [Phycisphaerales bacterium]|nr:hypothetical protein [Phycisphaerales bacterium]
MLPFLRLLPILKTRAWGGRQLAALGKALPPNSCIGESWELADLPESIPDGVSRIAAGPYVGRTIKELRASHNDALMGMAIPTNEGAFPLLVKFLDAADDLSVQLHPDAAYARAHPHAYLKCEAWIVLSAAVGARIYRGIKRDITREQFFAAVQRGDALDLLASFEVHAGDCIYLPSGICHALGRGILAAEIQTPSDTTFRIFDWNRNDPNRALHLTEAAECLRVGDQQEDRGIPAIVTDATALTIEAGGFRTQRLCRSPHFTIERMTALRETSIPITPSGIPEVWIVTAGALAIAGDGFPTVEASRGDTLLRPASAAPGIARCSAGTTILRTTPANALDRALA